jgi:hypothetical protein
MPASNSSSISAMMSSNALSAPRYQALEKRSSDQAHLGTHFQLFNTSERTAECNDQAGRVVIVMPAGQDQ